jgi:hypothetical protein
VVAKVDDNVITVGDVQERLNKQSPFIRARYTTVEKKKEFLDNLVRFEVMAREAQRRGYDKDPEVQRVMKQQMISKFLQKDFDVLVSGLRVVPCGRDLGTDVADPVIEPACEHKGEGAQLRMH